MWGRKRTAIYRDGEIVIVTCDKCGHHRLLKYRSQWGREIPLVTCHSCACKKMTANKSAAKRLRDFEECLEVLEIVQSSFTLATPLLIKTPVNAMLREYNRGI